MYIVIKRVYANGHTTIGYNKVSEGENIISSSTKTYTTGEVSYNVSHNKSEKKLIEEFGLPYVSVIAIVKTKELAKLIKRKV